MESNSIGQKIHDSANDVSNSAAGEHARKSLEEARTGAKELVTQGSDAVHATTAQARKALNQRSEELAHYVQAKPVKSLMLATAAGALITLLAGALKKKPQR